MEGEALDTEVRARLGVEALGNNLGIIVSDKDTVLIPLSMVEDALEALHQAHQGTRATLPVKRKFIKTQKKQEVVSDGSADLKVTEKR